MKNKHGQAILLTLSILVLVVGGYTLGGEYLKQRQQRQSLTSRIAETTRTLAQMPPPPEDAGPQLAAAQDNLTAMESTFPDRINSTRTIDAILKLADDTGVKAIPLITQPWSMSKVGEHDYFVMRLNVSVSGSFSGLTAFTGRLENGDFPTLVIEDLAVARDVVPPEGSISEPAMPVSASLDLAIYTRPAPAE
jgi:hypothetical protein